MILRSIQVTNFTWFLTSNENSVRIYALKPESHVKHFPTTRVSKGTVKDTHITHWFVPLKKLSEFDIVAIRCARCGTPPLVRGRSRQEAALEQRFKYFATY